MTTYELFLTTVTSRQVEKILDPTPDGIGDFLRNPGAKGIKRRQRVFSKVEERINEDNIKVRTIPDKQIVPILHGIATEDDENIIELWTNLLTNTAREDSIIDRQTFANILSEMNRTDARTFAAICKCTVDAHITDKLSVRVGYSSYEGSSKYYKSGNRDSGVSLDNLIRLRLIERKDLGTFWGYCVTHLGFEFMKATQWKNTSA